MMNQYSIANGWHYTDIVAGITPDLHHAILHKDMVLRRSFVGFMLDTKDIPCKGGKARLNVHTLRQKRRSCLYQVKLEVQKNH
jgi:hypothetical protein